MFESTLEKVFLRKVTSLRIDSSAKVTVIVFLGVHGQCRICELGHSHAKYIDLFFLCSILTACVIFWNWLCNVISQIWKSVIFSKIVQIRRKCIIQYSLIVLVFEWRGGQKVVGSAWGRCRTLVAEFGPAGFLVNVVVKFATTFGTYALIWTAGISEQSGFKWGLIWNFIYFWECFFVKIVFTLLLFLRLGLQFFNKFSYNI